MFLIGILNLIMTFHEKALGLRNEIVTKDNLIKFSNELKILRAKINYFS